MSLATAMRQHIERALTATRGRIEGRRGAAALLDIDEDFEEEEDSATASAAAALGYSLMQAHLARGGTVQQLSPQQLLEACSQIDLTSAMVPAGSFVPFRREARREARVSPLVGIKLEAAEPLLGGTAVAEVREAPAAAASASPSLV